MYRQIRLRMTGSEVSTKSRMIGRRLLNDTDWRNHKDICIFETMMNLNEIVTGPVISRLKAQNINVEILPQDKKSMPPTRKFDLIIIPCLAFDESRHRLGWGGGWYDRFLARQPQALKVGLAYQNSLVDGGLPIEPHDVALDKIITEERVY